MEHTKTRPETLSVTISTCRNPVCFKNAELMKLKLPGGWALQGRGDTTFGGDHVPGTQWHPEADPSQDTTSP